MSKRNVKSPKMLPIIIAVLIVVFAAIAVMVAQKGNHKVNEPSNPRQEDVEKPKSTELFDDGRLKLVGSMEYEGPDFDDGSMEEGTYTMFKIQNVSDSFLRQADIEVKVNDTDRMKLTIDSIPAGMTVMVIGQDYHSYSDEAVYEVVSCESSYEEEISDGLEGVEVVCEMGMIQVINQSGEELSNVTFRYKGKADDMLLGGAAYEFTVDSLSSGDTFETGSQSFLADSIQIVEIK